MHAPKSPLLFWSGYLLAGGLLIAVWHFSSHLRDVEARPEHGIRTVGFSSPAISDKVVTQPAVSTGIFDARTQTLLGDLKAIADSGRSGEPNQRFLDKAAEIFLDNDYERRTRNTGILLEIMRPEDGPDLHRMFARMHQEGRDYGDEYARFATQWGKVAGSAALDFLFGQGIPVPNWDAHNVLKGWAQQRPQEALVWALGNRSEMTGRGLEDPVHAVIRGLARVDPIAATVALNEHFRTPESRIEPTREIYIESLFGRGLATTIDWLKQLPDSQQAINPAGRNVFMDIFGRMRASGAPADEVAQHFLSLADQPWVGISELDATARMFDGNGAAMMEQLASPSARGVMQDKFASWAAQNSDGVGDWLNQNRSSPIYDLAAAELARNLKTLDPEAAAMWARTIQDPALKERARK